MASNKSDSNLGIGINVTVNGITDSNAKEVSSSIKGLAKNLSDSLVISPKFADLGKIVTQAIASFRELSVIAAELKSNFSDVSKIYKRNFDDFNMLLKASGVVTKKHSAETLSAVKKDAKAMIDEEIASANESLEIKAKKYKQLMAQDRRYVEEYRKVAKQMVTESVKDELAKPNKNGTLIKPRDNNIALRKRLSEEFILIDGAADDMLRRWEAYGDEMVSVSKDENERILKQKKRNIEELKSANEKALTALKAFNTPGSRDEFQRTSNALSAARLDLTGISKESEQYKTIIKNREEAVSNIVRKYQNDAWKAINANDVKSKSANEKALKSELALKEKYYRLKAAVSDKFDDKLRNVLNESSRAKYGFAKVEAQEELNNQIVAGIKSKREAADKSGVIKSLADQEAEIIKELSVLKKLAKDSWYYVGDYEAALKKLNDIKNTKDYVKSGNIPIGDEKQENLLRMQNFAIEEEIAKLNKRHNDSWIAGSEKRIASIKEEIAVRKRLLIENPNMGDGYLKISTDKLHDELKYKARLTGDNDSYIQKDVLFAKEIADVKRATESIDNKAIANAKKELDFYQKRLDALRLINKETGSISKDSITETVSSLNDKKFKYSELTGNPYLPIDPNTEFQAQDKAYSETVAKRAKEANRVRIAELENDKKFYKEKSKLDKTYISQYEKVSSELIKIKSESLTGNKKEAFILKQKKDLELSVGKLREPDYSAEEKALRKRLRFVKDSADKELGIYQSLYRNMAVEREAESIASEKRYREIREKQLRKTYSKSGLSESEIRTQIARTVDADVLKAKQSNSKNFNYKQELTEMDWYYNQVKFKDKNYYQYRLLQIENFINDRKKLGIIGAREEAILRKQQLDALNHEQNQALGRSENFFKNMMAKVRSALVMVGGFFVLKQIIIEIANVGIQFEDVMAGVKAVTGANAEEFDRLNNSARELGKNSRYTAVEVAKLQDIYAKLGFSVASIINASAATVNLATATGEDLAKSAEAVATTLNGFGLGAEKTAEIADIMAQSFVDSALDLERYVEAMKMVAPVSRALNFSVAETTAMMAKLSDVGINGTMAGTGMRNIISQISDSGSKLSKVLGGTANNWQEFISLLQAANRRGVAFKQEALEDIDLRIKNVVLALVEQSDALDDVAVSYGNATGAAKEMADIRMNTLAGDLKKFMSAFNEEKLQLFDRLNGSTRATVQILTKLVRISAELFEVALDAGKIAAITGLFYGMANGIKAVTGAAEFSRVVGGLEIVRAGMTSAAISTGFFARMMNTLKASMMAHPVMWIAGTLAAVLFLMKKIARAEEDAIDDAISKNTQRRESLQLYKAEEEAKLKALKSHIELSKAAEKDTSLNDKKTESFKRLQEMYPGLVSSIDSVLPAYKAEQLAIEDINNALIDNIKYKEKVAAQKAVIEAKNISTTFGIRTTPFEFKTNKFTDEMKAAEKESGLQIRKINMMLLDAYKISSTVTEDNASEKIPAMIERANKSIIDLKVLQSKLDYTNPESDDERDLIDNKIAKAREFIQLWTSASKLVGSSKLMGSKSNEEMQNQILYFGEMKTRLQSVSSSMKEVYNEALLNGDKPVFTGFGISIDEFGKKLDELKGKSEEDIFALTGLDGESFKKLQAYFDDVLAEYNYFTSEKLKLSENEYYAVLSNGDDYLTKRTKQVRKIFYSEEQWNKLTEAQKTEANQKISDIMESRRKLEEAGYTGKKDVIAKAQESLLKSVASMHTVLLDKEFSYQNALKDIIGMEATNRSNSADKIQGIVMKNIVKNAAAQFDYLDAIGKAKDADGKLTPAGRALRYTVVKDDVFSAEKYSPLTDAEKEAIVQKQLNDDKKSAGSRKTIEEQLKQDIIAIRQSVRKSNKDELEKELADIENFYEKKLGLMDKYADGGDKFTSKDRDFANKLYTGDNESKLPDDKDYVKKHLKSLYKTRKSKLSDKTLDNSEMAKASLDFDTIKSQKKIFDYIDKSGDVARIKAYVYEYTNFLNQNAEATKSWFEKQNQILIEQENDLLENESLKKLNKITSDKQKSLKELGDAPKAPAGERPTDAISAKIYDDELTKFNLFNKTKVLIEAKSAKEIKDLRKAIFDDAAKINDSELKTKLDAIEKEQDELLKANKTRLQMLYEDFDKTRDSDAYESGKAKSQEILAQSQIALAKKRHDTIITFIGVENQIYEMNLRNEMDSIERLAKEKNLNEQELMELKDEAYKKQDANYKDEYEKSELAYKNELDKINSIARVRAEFQAKKVGANVTNDDMSSGGRVNQSLSIAESGLPDTEKVDKIMEMWRLGKNEALLYLDVLKEINEQKNTHIDSLDKSSFFGTTGQAIADAWKKVGSFSRTSLSAITEDVSAATTTTLDAAAGIVSQFSQISQMEMDRELERISSAKDEKLKVLDEELEKGVYSKSQYEAKKKKIDDDAKEQEKAAKKKHQKWALAEVWISTASSIAKGFAQFGPVIGALMIPLSLAMATAQTAAINAQKFAKGGYTGIGVGQRDETGEKVAGIVHEQEVVFERPIVQNNLKDLLRLRKILQSGVRLKDLISPKINLSKIPLMPQLPKFAYATGGQVIGMQAQAASLNLTSDSISKLMEIKQSIEIMNQNLIEKIMQVNVFAKTIDPIDVHDLAEKGKKSKDSLY